MKTSALIALLLMQPALAQDAKQPVTLTLQRNISSLIALPPGAKTIVIGNPHIADALIEGNMLVLTAKTAGATNLLAADGQGRSILNLAIAVADAGPESVHIFRGSQRESLLCSPLCEPASHIEQKPLARAHAAGASGDEQP